MTPIRLCLALLLAASAVPADAATFVVTNTLGSGAGSLSQAITSANLTTDADLIQFNISSAAAVKTIGGTLPAITQPVTIDGYSQAGSTKNTATDSTTNAVIRIELDASGLAIGAAMLTVTAGPTTIQGLAIKGIAAKRFGIDLDGDATSRVRGCFIGTDATGTTDASGGFGIIVRGTADIGGSSVGDRNLISGNNGAGVQLKGDGLSLTNNLIGTDAGGASVLGNGSGLLVSSSTILSSIGGSSNATRNVFAGNTTGGILVTAAATGSVAIGVNSFFDNVGLAIDLGVDGVTPNDDGDTDGGPNGKQNYPELGLALINGGAMSLEGYLDSQPGTYRISVYGNAEADSSGFGEGQFFLESFEVEIPGGETRVSFNENVVLSLGDNPPFPVTATAESLTTGATSEFSRALDAVAGGTQLVVTTTSDSGVGSLRSAIAIANQDQEPNTIVFDIPGDPPHTIFSQAGYKVTGPVVIDGYSQPGSSQNTLEVGSNAVLGVFLDGSQTTQQLAKVLLAAGRSGTLVRGIGIHSAPGAGMGFSDGTLFEDSAVEGCFFGVDPGGTTSLGINAAAVVVSEGAQDFRVGGLLPSQRNVISGSDSAAISDFGVGTRILNNLIGVDATGEDLLGNGGAGIDLLGTATVVGSDDPAAGNVIRGNAKSGIQVFAGSGHRILANSISDNDGLGIDLSPAEDGSFEVTDNDADDADGGANASQNFPVIVDESILPGSAKFTGTLDVPAQAVNATYTLRFYDNLSCDESGHGEGEVFLGAVNVALSGDDEEFLVDLPIDLGDDHLITATATEIATGNTSEFSECFGTIEPPSPCGDANGDGSVSAADGLLALKTAVGSAQCDVCRCDTNGGNGITTSDALLILRVGVGQSVSLTCPLC